MRARLPTLILLALLIALQYAFWLGKGGWYHGREFARQLAEQRAQNQRLETRNAGLVAEVRDLKSGLDAIEERARTDLGMVGSNETFFQVVPPPPAGEAPPPEEKRTAQAGE